MTLRAAGLLLLCVTLAPAQEGNFVVREGTGPADRELVQVSWTATPLAVRERGWGWITVRLNSRDAHAHRATVFLGHGSHASATLVERTVALGPNGGAEVTLPLPMQANTSRCVVRLDGDSNLSAASQLPSWTAGVGYASVLLIADVATDLSDWLGAYGSIGNVVPTVRTPAALPDRWQFLSGADVIVLDPAAHGLTPERQRVVVDRVYAGARMIVLNAASARALEGPLRDMLADVPTTTRPAAPAAATFGSHGLGSWLLLSGAARTGLERILPPGVNAGWLTPLPDPDPGYAALPARGLTTTLAIPGVGEVPIAAFVGLILAFIATVGTILFVQVRRRTPQRLLIHVPAVGLGFTGIILLYGLVFQGLGTQGAMRSLMLLDQRTHVAATVIQQTLFAGTTPATLIPGDGTLVVPGRGAGRINMDAGVKLLGVIPARTPTTLATVTVDRCRERLHFRRRTDGGLDILADSAFAPTAGAGQVVLRDFAGAVFASDAGGVLRPVAAADATRLTGDLAKTFADMPLASDDDPPRRGLWSRRAVHDPTEDAAFEPADVLANWCRGAVGAGPMRAGTYLASMRAVPSLDHLGLDVEWKVSRHVVAGILAREDIDE